MLDCNIQQFHFGKTCIPDDFGHAASDEAALFLDLGLMKPMKRFPVSLSLTKQVDLFAGLKPNKPMESDKLWT